jgi:predicted aspartyl protease
LIRKFLLAGAVALALAGCASSSRTSSSSALTPAAMDPNISYVENKCEEGDTAACQNLMDLCQNGNAMACIAARRGLNLREAHLNAYGQSPAPNTTASPVVSGRSEIALRTAGGTFTVPVSVNGAITLDFTLDTGATDVSIPADVVMTLMRTGTIDRGDFLGDRTYVMADGSTVPSTTFRIRSLRVGDHEIRNVTGSIAPVKGSLLLGQSFLRQFGSWSIDNRRGVLVLD